MKMMAWPNESGSLHAPLRIPLQVNSRVSLPLQTQSKGDITTQLKPTSILTSIRIIIRRGPILVNLARCPSQRFHDFLCKLSSNFLSAFPTIFTGKLLGFHVNPVYSPRIPGMPPVLPRGKYRVAEYHTMVPASTNGMRLATPGNSGAPPDNTGSTRHHWGTAG